MPTLQDTWARRECKAFLVIFSLTRNSSLALVCPALCSVTKCCPNRLDTTDNACFTAQACYFTVSFAGKQDALCAINFSLTRCTVGSGIQLVRFAIHDIAIPLLATVTLDGAPQTGISIPDDQAVVVYDLQGFPYGDHVLRVDLLSWNSTEPSHFRLDRAIINETEAVTTASASTSTSTISASTTPRSSSVSQSPPTPGSSTGGVTKK
jgi:hypothetical protein